MGMPTALEIKDYLEGFCGPESGVSNSWIERERDSVVRWVEARIRQRLSGVKEYEEYVSGTGSPIIVLSRKDIVSVVSIKYVGAAEDFEPRKNAVEVVSGEGILRARDSYRENRYPLFPRGKYNIRVKYLAGYESIPEDIADAIIKLTCERLLGYLAGRDGGGMSITVDGFSRNYGSRGKFTEIRNDLARMGLALIKPYMTGVSG